MFDKVPVTGKKVGKVTVSRRVYTVVHEEMDIIDLDKTFVSGVRYAIVGETGFQGYIDVSDDDKFIPILLNSNLSVDSIQIAHEPREVEDE